MSQKNIFDGESLQAQFAVIAYQLLMSGEWITYSDIMARYMGFNSADELPYNVSNCEGYGELKKVFPKVCQALKDSNGDNCITTDGGNKCRKFRYNGEDTDPLGVRFSVVKKDLADYYQFCQNSAGFMPSVWLDHFFAKTQIWFEIDKRKRTRRQIIGTSIDRKIKNIELLPQFYDFINAKKPVKFTYRKRYTDLTTLIFHPHYIKEFNGRWHVFGHAEGNEPSDGYNVALDRIEGGLEVVKDVNYIPPQSVQYPDFFKDIVGTSISKDPLYDNIVIRIFGEYKFGLVESKPIHHTQITTLPYDPNLEYGEVTLKLRPNNEFYGRVLQLGHELEIIGPYEVRKEISQRIQEMSLRYK